jgi:hypothetical protein
MYCKAKSLCVIRDSKTQIGDRYRLKGVVGVNKARVKENCFFIIESWEKKYYEKNMTLWLDKATQKWFDWF